MLDRAAVVYFMMQSCLYIATNYLRAPETDQNMPSLSPYHCPVPNSANSLKT